MPEQKSVKYVKERNNLKYMLKAFTLELDPLNIHLFKKILTRDEHRKIQTILEKVKALTQSLG